MTARLFGMAFVGLLLAWGIGECLALCDGVWQFIKARRASMYTTGYDATDEAATLAELEALVARERRAAELVHEI